MDLLGEVISSGLKDKVTGVLQYQIGTEQERAWRMKLGQDGASLLMRSCLRKVKTLRWLVQRPSEKVLGQTWSKFSTEPAKMWEK